MWDKFNSWFDSTISGDPIFYGIIIILISIALLAFRIYFKESTKMKDHDLASWDAFVNSWVVIVGVFLLGLFLIINNL